MDNQYFIYKDKRQQGPFTPEQLAGMGITSETFVWREGMGQWLPAWQVDELKGLFGSKQGGAPVPPPPPQVEEPDAGGGNVQAAVPETPVRQPDRRRRRAITWLAVAAVAFFVLLMTCPGEERHRQAVVDEIRAAVRTDTLVQDGGDDLLGFFGGTLGDMIVARFADAVVGQFMRVDNYVLFSVGRIDYGKGSRVVSVGVLGHVFTFDADELRNVMKKNNPLPGTLAV